MSLEATVKTIVDLAKEKFQLEEKPENGKEYLCIKEEKYGKNYEAEVAIGTGNSMSMMFYNISGFVFESSIHKFNQNTLKIEPKVVKTTRGMDVTLARLPDGFRRKVDELSWDQKFTSLEDLIAVIKEF